jgi:hypothetical protein
MMRRSRCRARLFINGVDVGAVAVKGWEGSWGIGEFLAGEAFAPYAPRFARWSQLMHEDAGADRLSDAALQELRRVECELDALRAELLLCDSGQRRRIRQLNIDGQLIEWKEDRGPGAG